MSLLPSASAPPQDALVSTRHSPQLSMNGHDAAATNASSLMASTTPSVPLDGHADARALVRLVQCPICSRPLTSPVTLPCGNSLCRACLPAPHLREHVSYPPAPVRQQGITCPFADCAKIHPLEDCSLNVVLLHIMDSIRTLVSESASTANAQLTLMEAYPSIDADNERPDHASKVEGGHSQALPGGRLVATFAFAELGQLRYQSEVTYVDPTDAQNGGTAAASANVLDRLKETTHKEVECHVCYNLMLDPITTPCGHTFCRKCLARILDHSSLCAVCRRDLPLPPSLSRQASNKFLTTLLYSLCPDQVEARAEAVALDEASAPGGLDTALFVCANCFPDMPFMLHVFEPRYRLMIRRALEGSGQFGMVGYNSRGQPQGTLGVTQFVEYGTMLQIEQYRILSDGRSYLACKGVSRFRVLAHGTLDGYIVGRVQKTEDISLAEEEQIEANETIHSSTAADDMAAQLDCLSTQEIFERCTSFLQRAQQQSARWLRGSIIQSFGEPPMNPSTLPYWFASVLPLTEEEKYRLLPTTSVRERLKIAALWAQTFESQRWFRGSACTLL